MNASELLIKLAQDLKGASPQLVALDMIKKAGVDDAQARKLLARDSFEKSAFSSLTAGGIDAGDAVKLVKCARFDESILSLDIPEEATVLTLEKLASVVEKMEAYIETLEQKVEELEKTASETPAPQEPEKKVSEPMSKLAGIASLAFEDLEALSGIPEETLTKIASTVESPWSMGGPSGSTQKPMDPIEAFVYG